MPHPASAHATPPRPHRFLQVRRVPRTLATSHTSPTPVTLGAATFKLDVRWGKQDVPLKRRTALNSNFKRHASKTTSIAARIKDLLKCVYKLPDNERPASIRVNDNIVYPEASGAVHHSHTCAMPP